MLDLARFVALAGVLGSALASPTQSLESRTDGNNRPFTPELYEDMKHNAQHAGAVYCNVDKAEPGDRIKCSRNGCPALEKNGVTIVDSFTGSITGIGGYVATDDVRKEIILTVRGTTNIRNLVTDAQFPLAPIDDIVEGGKTHKGAVKAWGEMNDAALAALAKASETHPDYGIVVVGHSLGALTASLGASYVRQKYPQAVLFTYGCPRIGNEIYAGHVSKQGNYRVEHYNDIAANIPPKFLGYYHTDTEYWLSTGPVTKAEYAFDQVKVCHGDKDGQCSNSKIPDVTGLAHRFILSDLYACGGLSVYGAFEYFFG